MVRLWYSIIEPANWTWTWAFLPNIYYLSDWESWFGALLTLADWIHQYNHNESHEENSRNNSRQTILSAGSPVMARLIWESVANVNCDRLAWLQGLSAGCVWIFLVVSPLLHVLLFIRNHFLHWTMPPQSKYITCQSYFFLDNSITKKRWL